VAAAARHPEQRGARAETDDHGHARLQLADPVSRKRSRPRAPKGPAEWTAAAICAILASSLVLDSAHSAMRAVPLLALGCGLAVLGAGCAIGTRRIRAAASIRTQMRQASGLQITMPAIDAMAPTDFERLVRDLMLRDGIRSRHVGRAGDQAADVIGTDAAGAVIVAQCKHTTVGGKVSVRVIYEVNGTARPVHRADTAIVVTNGSFTKDAREQARQFGIGLIDRAALHQWAGGARLQYLLKHAGPRAAAAR
jgi:restriction system protein